MSIRIVRPVVSIVNHRDGSSTYTVTAPNWLCDYERYGASNELKDTRKRAKSFAKEFDRLASEIESGSVRPFGIMRMFVQRNLFNSVRKLTIDPTLI